MGRLTSTSTLQVYNPQLIVHLTKYRSSYISSTRHTDGFPSATALDFALCENVSLVKKDTEDYLGA